MRRAKRQMKRREKERRKVFRRLYASCKVLVWLRLVEHFRLASAKSSAGGMNALPGALLAAAGVFDAAAGATATGTGVGVGGGTGAGVLWMLMSRSSDSIAASMRLFETRRGQRVVGGSVRGSTAATRCYLLELFRSLFSYRVVCSIKATLDKTDGLAFTINLGVDLIHILEGRVDLADVGRVVL